MREEVVVAGGVFAHATMGLRGESTQGTDRYCWMIERFSGSSVGRP